MIELIVLLSFLLKMDNKNHNNQKKEMIEQGIDCCERHLAAVVGTTQWKRRLAG